MPSGGRTKLPENCARCGAKRYEPHTYPVVGTKVPVCGPCATELYSSRLESRGGGVPERAGVSDG